MTRTLHPRPFRRLSPAEDGSGKRTLAALTVGVMLMLTACAGEDTGEDTVEPGTPTTMTRQAKEECLAQPYATRSQQCQDDLDEHRQAYSARVRATSATTTTTGVPISLRTYFSDPPAVTIIPVTQATRAPRNRTQTTMSQAQAAEIAFDLFMMNDPELSQLPLYLLQDTARATCDALDSGMSYEEMVVTALFADTGLSIESLGVLMGAAIGAYCPEYQRLLP